MLTHVQMPNEFQGDAVLAANHIRNQTPSKPLGRSTPNSCWHGRSFSQRGLLGATILRGGYPENPFLNGEKSYKSFMKMNKFLNLLRMNLHCQRQEGKSHRLMQWGIGDVHVTVTCKLQQRKVNISNLHLHPRCVGCLRLDQQIWNVLSEIQSYRQPLLNRYHNVLCFVYVK